MEIPTDRDEVSGALAARRLGSWSSGLGTGLLAGAGVAAAGAGALSVLGYYARMVVTPPPLSHETLRILDTGFGDGSQEAGGSPNSVLLPATPETLAPGRYTLSFNAGAGHAVIGEVLAHYAERGEVVRRVEKVRGGNLAEARRGRWSGAVFLDPADAGYAFEEVVLRLPVGEAPAWFVPAPEDSEGSTWAVMVHGRGAQRQETLRALAATQALGMSSLHVSYRNDHEAPPSPDGRYGLGLTEWEDVDAAISYALEHGARDVVLFGWSMGGAIALQTLDRSGHRDRIRALVLDGPVVDWFELIKYHSTQYRLPLHAGWMVAQILSGRRTSRVTGLYSPINLVDLDWVSRSAELTTPTLILHSTDDDFVPSATSEALAERNPHVDLVRFDTARHTKEWNVDPRRWDRTVTEWLSELLGSREDHEDQGDDEQRPTHVPKHRAG